MYIYLHPVVPPPWADSNLEGQIDEIITGMHDANGTLR